MSHLKSYFIFVKDVEITFLGVLSCLDIDTFSFSSSQNVKLFFDEIVLFLIFHRVCFCLCERCLRKTKTHVNNCIKDIFFLDLDANLTSAA